ncbi:MAG: OmpW/AlkL family protein [Marinicella sp.]
MRKILTTALAIMSLNVVALEQGDWLLHVRAINVAPNDDSSLISVDGTGVAGTGVTVDTGPSLDVSLGYMVTDRWAVEVLADLSSKHSVAANGLASLGVPNGTHVVDTNVLPPTVFMQYQFNPKGKVRPYAGVGLNYTLFFNDELTGAAQSVLGASNLDIDSSFGLAAQFGIDWQLENNWSFNVDLKYIQIDTEATFDTAIGRASVDIDINPTVIGIGLGKSF